MGNAKKKQAWLFEQNDGQWSMLRKVVNPRLIEDIQSIEAAEYIANLLNYKIVKIIYKDERKE
tara:strand:+ start:3693 stop:3881 length:189 start_codon:yes stop_codon:yes gene_type:complete